MFASSLPQDKLMEGGLLLLKLKPKRILLPGEGLVGVGVRWREINQDKGKHDQFYNLKGEELKKIGSGARNIDKGYILTRFVDTVHDLLDDEEQNRPAAEIMREWLEEQTLKFPEDDKLISRQKELDGLLSRGN
eukprot:CAMPEP_0115037854 /NCGR_PEP_ID=MMETSP0216-20121206/43058_1 /TAXON_ID=223996 /ORGANISM="Protocruzia adherens, Strain Boccale" /LENGTH=133 /DNA_ID=CAMNT_0002418137 /DNA_START=112 /DNA_END=513 /DNA_ORIENTATION=-